MRDSKIQGKIVFVSSMLGLLSFTGYSTYSPTKYALRGLADTLRNELKRYNIDVHIFFPGNIDSPGFVTEVSLLHSLVYTDAAYPRKPVLIYIYKKKNRMRRNPR